MPNSGSRNLSDVLKRQPTEGEANGWNAAVEHLYANELFIFPLDQAKKEYEKPSVTVDGLIFRVAPVWGHQILLIKRKDDPFKDFWAIPGGFVNMDETVSDACHREIKEETGLDTESKDYTFLGFFDAVDRDPRGRVISFAFYKLYPYPEGYDLTPMAADDAKELEWFPVDELPPLAFDHGKIIEAAKIGALSK